MRPFRLVIFLLLVTVHRGTAQSSLDSLLVLPDSAEAFTLGNFYATLLANHPLVKQTRLLSETAQQEVRLARGAFDPKLEATWTEKEYKEVDYYKKASASLTIPTWFPIDPKLGVEQNEGTYINPESSISATDNYRQWVTGIRLPVGRGLVTDERRAAVKQAQLFTDLAEAEQVKLINKILLEAAKEYWQWYYAYYAYRLLSANTRIAEEVYRRVALNATLGEASAIDTVQAKITVQQRQIERQEALLEFLNSSIRVSNYLWDGDGQPAQLGIRVVPVLSADAVTLSVQTLSELKFMARQNHPELLKINAKLGQLDVERKLAAEYMKPRFDLKYGFINQPIAPDGSLKPFSLGTDYTWGFDFSIPLLLRKERAKLGQTRIKIRGTQLERSQAEREIVNQVEQVYNELVNTQRILDQQLSMVRNYERLLQAELTNLELGESDLFKINVQQEKLIHTQTKWLKLKADYEKARIMLYWAAGIPNLNALP